MAKRSRKSAPKTGTERKRPTLDDADRAKIWQLRDEGMTWREIQRETGFSFDSIARVLKSDPERVEVLAKVQAEHKQRRWEQLETEAQDIVAGILSQMRQQLFTPTGRPRKTNPAKAGEWLEAARPMLHHARLIAEGAGRRIDALRPRVTSSLGVSYAEGSSGDAGGPGGAAYEDWTDDDWIREALRLGMPEQLPARMRERLQRLVAEDMAGRTLGDEYERAAAEVVKRMEADE